MHVKALVQLMLNVKLRMQSMYAQLIMVIPADLTAIVILTRVSLLKPSLPATQLALQMPSVRLQMPITSVMMTSTPVAWLQILITRVATTLLSQLHLLQ